MSVILKSALAIVLATALAYGFTGYRDPIFVFTYAAAMRICG